jgi:hypothetical protein
MTYLKKLDSLSAVNSNAIANLSSTVKENLMNSHDQFRQVIRDLMWLNVTVYAPSEIYMAIRRLEFVLLELGQKLDDLMAAIQFVIQGNLPVKFIDPLTLQNILRNVNLQLPDAFELIFSTKTENMHQLSNS